MNHHSRLRRLGALVATSAVVASGAAVVGLTVAAAPASAAGVDTFCSTTAIRIPGAPGQSSGPADPFPSSIAVVGLTGQVLDVDVTINGFSHTWLGDLAISVTGPAGDSSVLSARLGGNGDASGTYTFDDSAPTRLGDPSVAPGAYQPSTSLKDAFVGDQPNGSWGLFINDQATSDIGNATGWCVTITTGNVAATTSTTLNLSPAASAFGQDVATSATVTSSTDPLSGSVQFAVDGTNVGAPAPVVSGRATGPVLDEAVGDHRVTATFIPGDGFIGSSDSRNLTVARADTAVQVTIGADSLQADVDVVAPGAGTPTGSVEFVVNGSSVGTAPVTAGTATLGYTVGDIDSAEVVARYSGDDSFVPSTGRTVRSTPTITAQLSSRAQVTRFGWYRTPVTVSFTCDANGAQLVGDCPSPVTVSKNGRGQRISRTITTTTGETATATVRVSLDRTAPRVRAAGVDNGATYSSAPRVRCVGSDALSGLARCTVTKRKVNARVTAYTVRATDRAGNFRTVVGRYTVR